MKKIDNILLIIFHLINVILITLYLYPGSILGFIVHNDLNRQPQISKDFIVSSNHFFVFIFISSIGILAYRNSKNINILINYLLSASIILELAHFIIPKRGFELKDLLGNILGTILIIGVYKFLKRYGKN